MVVQYDENEGTREASGKPFKPSFCKRAYLIKEIVSSFFSIVFQIVEIDLWG